MAKRISIIGAADMADVRSEAGYERDAKKGNASVKFAAFYREYVVDCGHSDATVAEVRAVFEREGN
jgi:hypothetical protein